MNAHTCTCVYEYMFTCSVEHIYHSLTSVPPYLYYVFNGKLKRKKSIDYFLPSKVNIHIYFEIENFLLFFVDSFLVQYIVIKVSLPLLLPALAHIPFPPLLSSYPLSVSHLKRTDF